MSSETDSRSLERPAPEVAAELLAAEPGTARAGSGPEKGDVVAGYRIEGLLGRGGMGEIYRAFHPTLERDAALKLLPARLTGSAAARRRLIHEARAASRLDHPNVQTVFDAGETEDGRVYLALAYYDGPTLSARLKADGELPDEEVRSLVTQLADGLAAAHEAGIVHRDVKPSNLILAPDGRLKILDFGIARATDAREKESGPTYGTIAYMSPEQTRGEPGDHRVDVWAFGVVLYEMLTGRRPFEGDDDGAVIQAIREREPPPVADLRPEAPADLRAVVDRCLRKAPSDRFPDIDAIRAALEESTRRAPRRSPTIPIVLGALATAGLAGALLFGEARSPDLVGDADGSVIEAASAITVLPFVSASADPAGGRLGRELAVTVSGNLDGLGPIRTADGDVVLSTIEGETAELADTAAAALAGDLSTTSYLRGVLSGAGDEVRVEAVLHEAASTGEIGRLTVSGPAGDLGALTDSVTLGVLRLVWRRGELPAPSYGALTTRSVPALRAYLDGELALADGRFADAVAAFDSAFAADSTFWYALWRSIYPRTYGENLRLTGERYEALYEHRAALPEPDRRLLEVLDAVDLAAELRGLRDLVDLFPGYWPARWTYANRLVHTGPLAGIDLSDTRRALEAVLNVHPTYLAAWEHLLWVAVMQRDAVRARDALSVLERVAGEGARRLPRDLLPAYRLLVADIERGGLSPEELGAKVAHLIDYAGPLPPIFHALDLLIYGGCATQREVNRAVLEVDPPADMADAHRFMLGWATACAGDWARGASIAGDAAIPSRAPVGPMANYGLGVVGTWLGELPPDRARALRPTGESDRPTDAAERRWLDGILAYAVRDRAGLDSARVDLAAHPAVHSDRLARSLDAFSLALAGDSAAAGRRLADLEEKAVDAGAHHRYGRLYPWLTPLDRLAAGRWLAASGDTLRALRLLRGANSVLQERHGLMGPALRVLAPRAALHRARLQAARGDSARAALHYGSVLHAYRAPAAPVREAVQEARSFVSIPDPTAD
ncbi:MAG: protein kinase domain-containing protein [Gemmatimonadota bacterium]